MEVRDVEPEIPENEFVFVHRISSEILRACDSMRLCDKILEVSSEVYIRVCGRSGKTWVSSKGNHRLMLEHARAFEDSIKQEAKSRRLASV